MTSAFPFALMCTTASHGGIELNTVRLASWMRGRGWPCIVACAAGSPVHDDCARMGIPVIALPAPKKYADIRNAARLSRALSAAGAEVLVTNAARDLNMAVLACAFSRQAPALASIQHMQHGVDKRDALHRWHHSKLAAWIAPLPYLALQTERRTTVPAGKIHVVPFGIETGRFPETTPQRRAAARAALALPQHHTLVGVVGRLDRGKGQEHLVEALALLERWLPGGEGRMVDAVFTGEETRGEQQQYGDRLRARAAQLGLEDRVHFRPFAEDVAQSYLSLDMFALTSLDETYGMVTIEAMASGLPVIATDAGGSPEIVRHGETGLLVPPADARALAAAIAELLGDASRAARIGAAARTDVLARYSHEAQCLGFEHVLELIRPRTEPARVIH